MKRTVMAIVEVEDSVNNGQVLDTLENKFIIDRNVCSLRDAVVLDEDGEYEHERYLNYLMNWIVDHHDDEFAGQSPVGFDEWLENEDADYEDVPDLVLEESDYECDEHFGRIQIDKSIFNNFVKHSYIKIQFGSDNANNVYTYVMVDETEDFIICDFIG